MPETIAPPTLAPDAPTADVFAHFTKDDPAFAQQPIVHEPRASEEPPAPTKEEPKAKEAPDPKDGVTIPDQFLGGKKDEAPVDEWEKLTEEPKGPLKHDNYKALIRASKEKVERLQAEIAERETKLTEFAKKPADEATLKRLEAAEAALAEREAILERIAVTESPKYRERFTTRETAISERLKRTATDMGLDNETLQQALGSTIKRRGDLLDNLDMGPTVRGQVDSLMVQYDLLQDDKQNFLAQSKEEASRWQQEQKATMEHQARANREREDKLFEQIGEEMAKSYAPYQEVEGNPKWNAQAKALKEEAKKYFNGELLLEDLARVVYKGVGAQAQEQITAALHAKLEAAHKEIAALKSSQPGHDGHLAAPDGKEDDSHLTPQQRAMQTFRRFQSGAQNNGFTA